MRIRTSMAVRVMNLEDLINRSSDSGNDEEETTRASMSDLGKKTVDEVWREIQLQGKKGGQEIGEAIMDLGEMTLEDYLVKSGALEKQNAALVTGNDLITTTTTTTTTQNSQHEIQRSQHHRQQEESEQNVMEGFMAGHSVPLSVVMVPSSNVVVVSEENQLGMSYSDAQTCGRKRVCSGDIADEMVERKHKRMIKNRESAARSRARRKAYTNELENKISRLEEENKKLKEEKSSSPSMPTPPQETKYQLRRTSSASF